MAAFVRTSRAAMRITSSLPAAFSRAQAVVPMHASRMPAIMTLIGVQPSFEKPEVFRGRWAAVFRGEHRSRPRRVVSRCSDLRLAFLARERRATLQPGPHCLQPEPTDRPAARDASPRYGLLLRRAENPGSFRRIVPANPPL